MANKKRESKKHVLDCLEKARKASIEEQDRYHGIVENSLRSDTNEGINQKILPGGWNAVLKIMQDCLYPPDQDERERFLKISWDQELNSIKLEKISDKDIRFMTYFLNATIEHTQRIRAMAMFAERIGLLNELGATLFNLWKMRTSMQVIHDEAVLMGMEADAETIRQLCSATDKAASLLLRQ